MSVNKKPYKDPDVWDPPPPMQKPRQPVKRVSKNVSYAPQNNYNRNKPNQPGRNKKNGDPKKDFIYSRYPDGNGPDTNLI